jgi:hypothetical protein
VLAGREGEGAGHRALSRQFDAIDPLRSLAQHRAGVAEPLVRNLPVTGTFVAAPALLWRGVGDGAQHGASRSTVRAWDSRVAETPSAR